MAENTNWGKTLLLVYKYLSKVSDAMDRLFRIRAEHSAVRCSCNIAFNQTLSLTTDLINLTERKVNLINLKVLIERGLLGMDRDGARLLIAKFIDGKQNMMIIKMFNFSIRTYFRKLSVAVEKFNKNLTKLGYGSQRLLSMANKEYWIMEIFHEVAKDECLLKEFIVTDAFISNVCKNINKVAYAGAM